MQLQLFFIFFLLLSSVNSPYTMCCAHSAQWSQIAKPRHKISSIDVISRVFPSKFQQIHIYFHFRGIRFTLRNCQTVAGIIVRSVNFTIFKNLIFGGFLTFGPTVQCTEGQFCFFGTPCMFCRNLRTSKQHQ